MKEHAEQSRQDAARTDTAAMVEEQDAQVRRTEASTIAALRKSTSDADIAIWFGPQTIAWQTKKHLGVDPDLDSAFHSIRLSLWKEDDAATDSSKAAQDRIIRQARERGDKEPAVGP